MCIIIHGKSLDGYDCYSDCFGLDREGLREEIRRFKFWFNLVKHDLSWIRIMIDDNRYENGGVSFVWNRLDGWRNGNGSKCKGKLKI